MINRKIKWLIYTVLIGLIPILSRFLVWLVSIKGATDVLSSSDFVAFGLVLHVSIINEIEHLDNEGIEKDWKTVLNGLSIVFIVFYGILFALELIGEKVVNVEIITICSIVLSILSFLISYTVYHKLTYIKSIDSRPEA